MTTRRSLRSYGHGCTLMRPPLPPSASLSLALAATTICSVAPRPHSHSLRHRHAHVYVRRISTLTSNHTSLPSPCLRSPLPPLFQPPIVFSITRCHPSLTRTLPVAPIHPAAACAFYATHATTLKQDEVPSGEQEEDGVFDLQVSGDVNASRQSSSSSSSSDLYFSLRHAKDPPFCCHRQENPSPRYVIVGLGNPGFPFVGTRHNLGRDLIEELQAKWGQPNAADQDSHAAKSHSRSQSESESESHAHAATSAAPPRVQTVAGCRAMEVPSWRMQQLAEEEMKKEPWLWHSRAQASHVAAAAAAVEAGKELPINPCTCRHSRQTSQSDSATTSEHADIAAPTSSLAASCCSVNSSSSSASLEPSASSSSSSTSSSPPPCHCRVVFAVPNNFMNISGRPIANMLQHYDVRASRLILISDDIHLPLGRIRVQRGWGTVKDYNPKLIQTMRQDMAMQADHQQHPTPTPTPVPPLPQPGGGQKGVIDVWQHLSKDRSAEKMIRIKVGIGPPMLRKDGKGKGTGKGKVDGDCGTLVAKHVPGGPTRAAFVLRQFNADERAVLERVKERVRVALLQLIVPARVTMEGVQRKRERWKKQKQREREGEGEQATKQGLSTEANGHGHAGSKQTRESASNNSGTVTVPSLTTDTAASSAPLSIPASESPSHSPPLSPLMPSSLPLPLSSASSSSSASSQMDRHPHPHPSPHPHACVCIHSGVSDSSKGRGRRQQIVMTRFNAMQIVPEWIKQ